MERKKCTYIPSAFAIPAPHRFYPSSFFAGMFENSAKMDRRDWSVNIGLDSPPALARDRLRRTYAGPETSRHTDTDTEPYSRCFVGGGRGAGDGNVRDPPEV